MRFFLRRAPHGEDGQVLAIFAVSIVFLLAITALAIDFGFALHAYSELEASTNAAATAGALDLPNSTAVATATSYSGVSGSKNAYGDLPNVTMVSGYPQTKCLSYMVNLGLSCDNAASANAIAVVQQVSVPTFFARVIGVSSITLRASALAAMKGGTPAPSNVMVILDTTASMAQSDSDPTCKSETGISNPTKLDCAKWGVRTLLTELSPCASNLQSCGTVTNANVPNPVNEVGLLTYPGLISSASASTDYSNCQASNIKGYIAPYADSATQPPYFTIVAPSSDYRTSDSSGLNGSTSSIVQAVDWQDGVGCTSSAYGLQDPGGVGTYYAGVLTQAQADLSALTGSRASVQNAIILLSDGDANATNKEFSAASLNNNPNLDKNECHQAIAAAQAAAATQNAVGLNTWVYSIAFGSSTGSSCSTDSPAITACQAMTQIASDATKFYSDNANGCSSAAHPSITSLGGIFHNITYDFLTTRLLPFDTE